jgi:hypothetical protein
VFTVWLVFLPDALLKRMRSGGALWVFPPASSNMAPSEEFPSRAEVDRFILTSIDSVPHLEALLLLWQNPSEQWTVDAVSKRLWIDHEATRSILNDLARNQFVSVIVGDMEQYTFRTDPGNDRILRGVAEIYRQEIIRISTMIHAKPSLAVRAFARAFRFTKEKKE